jgi:hypothetical protein
MAKVVTDVVGGIGTLLGFSAPAKATQASTQVIQAPAPPTPAAAPTVAPPMPTLDQTAINAAVAQQTAIAAAGSGRASTILSQTQGGPTNNLLGG